MAISEEGRKARFEQWDKYGPEAIKQDLLNGGTRLVGGPPEVRELAYEYVQIRGREQGGFQKTVSITMRSGPRPGSLDDVLLGGQQSLNDVLMGSQHPGSIDQALNSVTIPSSAAVKAQEPSPSQPEQKEILTLKPTFCGMSIDLKEAWKRFRGRKNRQ